MWLFVLVVCLLSLCFRCVCVFLLLLCGFGFSENGNVLGENGVSNNGGL